MTQFKKEMFEFASTRDSHDKKLSTKPVTYLKDAWNRFKKNRASVVAGIIIIFLFLFALFVPILSPYNVTYRDTYFRFTLPKNPLFVSMGLDFWDGASEKEVTQVAYDRYDAMGVETGQLAIKNNKVSVYTTTRTTGLGEVIKTDYYKFRLDSYYMNGLIFMHPTAAEYQSIQDYQDSTGRQVIYPITQQSLRPAKNPQSSDANYWYVTNSSGAAVYDRKGDFQNIYLSYDGKDDYNSTVRIEPNGEKLYNYAIKMQKGYEIRVNYYEYYIYRHNHVLKDGIGEPMFLFGTTAVGEDILVSLASGARFSFLLAFFVSLINFTVGAMYGAIAGYYGGKTDLLMERIRDVLGGVPFIIVITLFRLHIGKDVGPIVVLLLAFLATGWIGMAGNVRMQFYRYKNQEYILAARTLGARDRRLMFKHIFPNALGTIITSSVLIVPAVIFQEAALSYLGILDISSGTTTSVGTLLSNGQPFLVTFPHVIFFPSLFISLLMLAFNLFGNGLRDAFNPSLRGAED